MLGPPPLPRNLDAAIRDLESARPEVRVSAIEDLVRHGRTGEEIHARAVKLLVARLTDAHPRVRSAAAIALGDLEAEDAVDALVKAIDDDDAHVRQMALNALGEIEHEDALPRVRRALRDARPEVRYQAIIAFARIAKEDAAIADALLDATQDDDDAIVHIALRLAEERLDAKKPVDHRMIVRANALLSSPSSHVALVAAIVLAKSKDERGHDLVLRVVRGEKVGGQTPDKEDERAAVELAGELGLTAAIPHLEKRVWGLGRLVRDTCTFHARIALARMGHERARKEILDELESTKTEVRSGAVVSAGRARLVEAKPKIQRLTEASVDAELLRDALLLLEEGAT
jgi:HEAT repeat protein